MWWTYCKSHQNGLDSIRPDGDLMVAQPISVNVLSGTFISVCIMAAVCSRSFALVWAFAVASGCPGPAVRDGKSSRVLMAIDYVFTSSPLPMEKGSDLPSLITLSLFRAALLAAFLLTSHHTAFSAGGWNRSLFSQHFFHETKKKPLHLFITFSRLWSLYLLYLPNVVLLSSLTCQLPGLLGA